MAARLEGRVLARGSLLASVLVFSLAACAHRGAHAPVEKELAQLKRDLVRGYLERDAPALQRIYCEDFLVTNARGEARSKAEEIAGLQDSATRLTSGRYEPIAIRSFGDVVVMYGHGELEGEGPDGPFDASYDSFNVFVKRDGSWCYAAAFTP